VVLAEAVELDVPDDDHLVALLLEDRLVQDLLEAHRVAPGQEPDRRGGAGGGLREALAGRVLSELGEDLGEHLFHGGLVLRAGSH
jgi:hypothetical protein